MVNFPTWIPDCDSHSPALLDIFVSSNASICSTIAFPPLGNSDHTVVSVSIDKESITSQKLGSQDFWQIPSSVLSKGKSVIPPLFNGLEVLSSSSDRAKLFAENSSKNSNLDDSVISLPVFPSRTNLKLHNISVTSKMVKKAIMNLDLSRHLVLMVFQWCF